MQVRVLLSSQKRLRSIHYGHRFIGGGRGLILTGFCRIFFLTWHKRSILVCVRPVCPACLDYSQTKGSSRPEPDFLVRRAKTLIQLRAKAVAMTKLRIRSARGSAATIRAPSATRRPGLSSRAWRRETAKNKAALAAPEERVSPSRLIPSP